MTKHLVLNADDLGISVPTNLAVERAHRRGILTSASLMANMQSTRHAVERVVQPNPALGIGLHLCLTSGRPVLPAAEIPLLVGGDGEFCRGFVSLWRLVKSSRSAEAQVQIAREMAAQARRLDELGIEIDHVDSHRHVHMIPEIFALAAPLAEARRAAIRVADETWAPRRLGLRELIGCLRHGGLVKQALLSRLAVKIRRKPTPPIADRWFGVLHSGGMTLPRLRSIVAGLEDGLAEIAAHPGPGVWIESPLDCSPSDQRFLRQPERSAELDALLDPRLRKDLSDRGVELVRFRDAFDLRRRQHSAQAE